MKILALDTTTKFICLGLSEGGRIYEYNLEVANRHAELLVPAIKRMLDAAGWSISDIDYFACGLGPGSFTGLRLGMSTIKGFAWALRKPVIGVSTLDILAQAASSGSGEIIIPVIDARRDLIYCAIYKNKGAAAKRISPYMLIGLGELLKKAPKGATFLGNALMLYKARILNKAKGASFLDSEYWYPRADSIIALVKEKIAAKKFNDAFSLKPIYLYPKECQIRKNA